MVKDKKEKGFWRRLWGGITYPFRAFTRFASLTLSLLVDDIADNSATIKVKADKDIFVPESIRGFGYEKIKLVSDDGRLEIYGVSRLIDSTKPTIMFFHGRNSSVFKDKVGSDYSMLSSLAKFGYNVIAVDPPGYGISKGPSSVRYHSQMASLVNRYVQHEADFPDGGKPDLAKNGFVIGRSLGVIASADLAQHVPLKGEIIVVPTTDLSDTMSNRLVPGLLTPLKRWMGYNFPIIEDTKNTKVKNALIVYNSYDEFAPPAHHVPALANAFPKEVNVQRHDVRRNDKALRFKNHMVPTAIYIDHLHEFIESCLEKEPVKASHVVSSTSKASPAAPTKRVHHADVSHHSHDAKANRTLDLH